MRYRIICVIALFILLSLIACISLKNVILARALSDIIEKGAGGAVSLDKIQYSRIPQGILKARVSMYEVNLRPERLFLFAALEKTLHIGENDKIHFDSITFDITAKSGELLFSDISASGEGYRISGRINYSLKGGSGRGRSLDTDIDVWLKRDAIAGIPESVADEILFRPGDAAWAKVHLETTGPKERLKVAVTTELARLEATLRY